MRLVPYLILCVSTIASAQQLERQSPPCEAQSIERARAGVEAGEAAQIYLMARYLSTGKCVAGDGKRALALYWQAAEKQYPPAYYNLGVVSAGNQDFASAELLFFRGAQLGHRGSELELGTLYMLAPEPVRNDEKAYAWLTVTKERHEGISQEAAERLEIVSKRISSANRERSDDLAKSLGKKFGPTPPFSPAQ